MRKETPRVSSSLAIDIDSRFVVFASLGRRHRRPIYTAKRP